MTDLSKNIHKKWLAGLLFAMIAGPIVCQAQLESTQSSAWHRGFYDEFDELNTPTNSEGNPTPDSRWVIGKYPWDSYRSVLKGTSSCYSQPEDSYLDTTNGWLVLRSRSGNFGGYPYSFGIVSGYHNWETHGILEIRAQYPAGAHVWPAFWMLHYGWPPEFDVAEYNTPGSASGSMHFGVAWGPDSAHSHWTNIYYPSSDYNFQDWHTYTLEWGQNYVINYIDGVYKFSYYSTNVYNDAMYVLLNSGMTSSNGTPTPNYYYVDYLRCFDAPAAAIDDNMTGTGLNQCNYSGTWGTGSSSDWFYGGVHWSGTSNNSVTVQFNGTRVDVFARQNVTEGIIAYSVDGGPETLVDGYSATDSHSALLWSGTGLPTGLHTLKMRVTGTKNPSASGTSLTLDRVNVWNTDPCLKGNIIGSTAASGHPLADAFDGDMNSYFSATTDRGAWVGYDLGIAMQITNVSYCSRPGGNGWKMTGASFQGANSADFSDAVNLLTIPHPDDGVMNDAAITNTSQFRYVRYLQNAWWTYGEVSELQFYGIKPLPSGWQNWDIGNVGALGSSSYASGSGVYTIKGCGNDIWQSADAFQYAYVSMTNNFTIKARVVSQGNTDPWAKAGVMARETTDAGSTYFGVYMTPTSSHGVDVQYRSTPGTNAVDLKQVNGPTTPYYIMLQRSGNTFTAYKSADGNTWGSQVAQQAIPMNSVINVGLAVCSHNTNALSTVTFDNVSIIPQ